VSRGRATVAHVGLGRGWAIPPRGEGTCAEVAFGATLGMSRRRVREALTAHGYTPHAGCTFRGILAALIRLGVSPRPAPLTTTRGMRVSDVVDALPTGTWLVFCDAPGRPKDGHVVGLRDGNLCGVVWSNQGDDEVALVVRLD